MFRFGKTLDIVSVFAKPNCPTSTRVANLVKQVSANLQTTATVDQAADHGSHSKGSTREPFEYNITQDAPTAEQLQTILDYVGKSGIPSIVAGARDTKEALKKFKESEDSFIRPLTVDWNHGKVVSGDNESQILKLLYAQKNGS
ncbi:hypothetical protein CDD82_6614 [Ophiocordyceps australis]|uniref:Glutaredoxin domain-containing protein n=1 Tax=Ophiocordyceps australis TaxID=1399860 RepID=A0A2C5ZUA1_9HYPO|nr:hypothetical protein CDD82_6614 [Ophiocordyceps australis]